MHCIFKIRANKRFVIGEENTRGQGREVSLQVKQHPTGYTGSADDIIFNAEPGV